MPSVGLKLLWRQADCGFKLLMTLPQVEKASASASVAVGLVHCRQHRQQQEHKQQQFRDQSNALQ
jgi:hypothetical protein